MIANYHTHTWRCRHAQGDTEEYVQQALAAGLEVLGFSDHTPYWFEGDHYSRFRMFPDQLEDYVNHVEAVRRQYAGRLTIHLGLEAEFYPKYFPELRSRLRDTEVEYLLLGQHYVGNEIGDWYSGKATADPDVFTRYCHQVCDAMQTGLFSYLAHPELIHFTGEDALYRAGLRQLCREANSCGIPVELNLLGIREGRHYPDRRFWELAAAEGCQVVLGCDAHRPEDLTDQGSCRKAMALVEELGLRLVDTVPLRPVR